VTLDAWAIGADCQAATNSPDAFSVSSCDLAIGLNDNSSAAFARCCCTDTH
jgi:hypothetical protein